MKQCNADGQRGRSDWAEETQSREPTAESREPTGCVISRLSASGPRRASLWRRLRPRENAATLVRGARACLALLAAAALLALAAPAQAQTEVWTATLTPADLGHGILGCSNNIATARCSSTTFLSEDSFNHDSTDYNITGLYVRSSGRFEILVNADLTTATAALTLVVGSTSFVLADANIITARSRVWFNTGASLTAGTDITVKLTAPGTPNTAPTAAHNTVTTVVDRPYTFKEADFGFADADTGETLASVKIVTLPALGTLAVDGTAVTTNEVVTRADIDDGDLTFTPVDGASGDGYASFTFKVNDGTVDSASAYTMTINVTSGSACAAPDFGTRRNIWTGTVTVEERVFVGVTISYGFSAGDASGRLDPTGFSVGLNPYVIDFASVSAFGVDISFGLTSSLTNTEVAALRLHICDTSYDFSDATHVSLTSTYVWTENLDWSTETSRTLYLSLPANNPATGAPVVTGTAQAGQELTADASPIMDTDGLPSSFTYRWVRVDADGTSNEEDITDATAATYTLTNDDAGKKVKVKVSFTDNLSGEEERTSAAYPSSGTVTAAPPGTNFAPTAAHNTVTTVVDRPYTFKEADFGFADADTGETLASVKIVTLPALGTLAVDGTAVTTNEVVTRADIDDGDLTFTPVDGASGDAYTTFTFKVNDGTVESASAYTMTINVTTGSACAAPDFGTRRNIWTGTVTVEERVFADVTISYGFSAGDASGRLDPTGFSVGLNPYVIDFASVSAFGVDISFGLTSSLTNTEVAALRLHICDTSYDFSDATHVSLTSTYVWTENLDWSTETSRTLYLSLPAAPPGTNFAPTAANKTVTTVVDRPYTFEADDFGFADADATDMLASVKIVTLPGLGTLALDGTAVMQNDVVAWDDIEDDKLTFTPVTGASGTGYANFTFKVNDGTVDSASAYTMTIDVTDAPALACAAPDLAGRNQIWTGELTVGQGIESGFTYYYGFDITGIAGGVNAGALDNPTFNIGRNSYTVRTVAVYVFGSNDGNLKVTLDRALRAEDKAALRLHVCDTPYDFSAARVENSEFYDWSDNLDWSSISSRTLYLSLPDDYVLPEPPGAPTGLSAQSVSGKPGYLRLSWTPALVVGLASIPTDYEARYRKTGATNWSPNWSFRSYGTPGFDYPSTTHAVPRGGNEAPLIYYLDPNTEYQVEVRATNSYGQSGWSNRVSATTAQATTANDDGTADADNGRGRATAPSQPTVRRVANEPGLMVRWNAPRTPTAGHILTGYDVEIEKERERDRRITTLRKSYLYKLAGGVVTNLLIPGLEPNTAYTVRVRAVLVATVESESDQYSAWSPDTSGTTAAGQANNIQLSLEFSDETRSMTVAPGAEVTYRVKATGIHDWPAVRARGGIGKAQIRIWEHGRHHRRAGYYQSTKGITYRHFIHQTGSSGYLEGTFIVPDEAGAGASGTIEIHLIPPSSRCGGTGTGNRCPVGSTVGGVNRSTNKLCIAVERSGDIAHPCSSGQTQVEAPTIEGTPRLSASGGDGAWTPGETVEATVTFSEAVTVDGTPTIGLMLGGTQKQSASYRSGSGTRELVFAYTLSESDGSHTAMGVALDSLALNGGSITSEATGADAELSHDGTIITGTRDDGRGVRELPRPTAQFSEVPATHDGATAFEVTLSISEAPGLDEGAVRGALEVSCASESCATVTGASRVTDRQWTVTVEPSQAYAITLRLPARACGETGAVCIGGRALAGPASATIPGRALTATLTHMPDEGDVKGEHKGSGTFEVRLVFNTEPRMSYKTVRDTMFDVTGGTITGARRVTRGNNQRFDIVVKPRGNDAMTFSLHSPLPACGETGSVCTEAGRMVEGPVSTTILGPVAISVADATVREEEGATLAFAVTLDREREADVTVDYATSNGTATAGEDYVAQSGDLTFAAGETAKTIEIEVLDDTHDEGTETMRLTLSNPSGARIADATATGRIENSDPMPKAWMVRFGRTVGSQVVDALTGRLEGGKGSHLTVAGIPLMGTTAKEPEAQDDDPFALPEWATSSAREAESHTVSLDDLLLRSTFHLRSGGEEGAGPAFTTWGRVATGGFEAEVDDVKLDGDVTTGMIGFDAEWERLLAGVMLSQSTGDGSYRLDPAKGTDGGTVESDLTGVYPYARIDLNDRVSAWGLAGAGSGTITLKRDAGKAMKTDLSMRMGAVGVKGRVLDGSGPSRIGLNVKSDAMWVGTKSARSKPTWWAPKATSRACGSSSRASACSWPATARRSPRARRWACATTAAMPRRAAESRSVGGCATSQARSPSKGRCACWSRTRRADTRNGGRVAPSA